MIAVLKPIEYMRPDSRVEIFCEPRGPAAPG
jgi:hypothetical protein